MYGHDMGYAVPADMSLVQDGALCPSTQELSCVNHSVGYAAGFADSSSHVPTTMLEPGPADDTASDLPHDDSGHEFAFAIDDCGSMFYLIDHLYPRSRCTRLVI